jgi:predicted pyridoxine 5'-phosphate oxidase superfamily flavin-nucleotide-binding protein
MSDGPFHAGELEAQARAGVASRGGGIRAIMPEQHRSFFAQLPWLFASVADAEGWPLATVLTGERGFVGSPTPTLLSIRALPSPGDPAAHAIRPGQAVGLLGIEFETRRRNRANGRILLRDTGGFAVAVSQSFGNCAKYIQIRTPEPAAAPAVSVVEPLAHLDDAARKLIADADTLFIASAATSDNDPNGGVDMSHRGGRPGFVRIDGDVLTVPDFVGNNYFNTLGNLLHEPRAALLFVDFQGGTMLQLQGLAEIVWDGPELSRLDGAQRLWRFRVTRGWRHRHALPLRWSAPDYAPTTLETGLWDASRLPAAS